MTHYRLKIIILIITLSKSLIIYASQHSNSPEISKNISAPNFQNIRNEMKLLFDEMIKLNDTLTSRKISSFQDSQAILHKKLDICIELKKDHIDPFYNKTNRYIKNNPDIKLNIGDFYTLKNYIREETVNTEKSIKKRFYVPDLPIVTAVVVPGKTTKQRIMEAQEARDKEIDKINKSFGGKLFLKRSDYIKPRIKIEKCGNNIPGLISKIAGHK
jgi:hypothetical protein